VSGFTPFPKSSTQKSKRTFLQQHKSIIRKMKNPVVLPDQKCFNSPVFCFFPPFTKWRLLLPSSIKDPFGPMVSCTIHWVNDKRKKYVVI